MNASLLVKRMMENEWNIYQWRKAFSGKCFANVLVWLEQQVNFLHDFYLVGNVMGDAGNLIISQRKVVHFKLLF